MKNYLDQWIMEKIGEVTVAGREKALSSVKESKESAVEEFESSVGEAANWESNSYAREKLEEYQLKKLKEVIEYAKEKNSFYQKHLEGAQVDFLEDIKKLPFTEAFHCNENLLCVSQGQVSRIVTLDSSGSTGKPKRIFFTEEDQELTIDFFHRGMENLIDETDNLLILMPTKTPGSIGDLLRIGVERMGAKVVPKGPLKQDEAWEALLDLIRKEKITSIVATPTQILKLIDEYYIKHARACDENKINLRSILVSAEYVPDEMVEKAEKAFNCKVFEHFGMTETGLGGAVSCYVLEGYHPREADLYFEIIDPKTGEVLEDGNWGELVFTTLTRKAMPFIRYKTGDISRWIKEPCSCGSYLKRLDKVQDRKVKKGERFYVK